MNKAHVLIIENENNKHHSFDCEYKDVQNLIDIVDRYCVSNDIVDVSVTAESGNLTQEDCDALADVWIQAIVD
jgi:isochorismate hydrolase